MPIDHAGKSQLDPAHADAPSILLVDDRPENLLALEEVLAPLGLNLVRAGSGEEALRRVLERDFAAILMDVQMPGLDGFETARMIQSRPRSRSTPIVFLTAIDTSPRRIREGYAAGGVDFIPKPFTPEILRAKVGVFAELYARGRQVQSLAAQAAAAAEQLRAAEEVRAAREAADAARTHVDQLLDGMTDAYVALDAGWRVVRINRAAEQALGVAFAELAGRTHWEAWPASVATELERRYRLAMETQQPQAFEHRHRAAGGMDGWLDVHVYPSPDRLDIFFRDISARKRAEQRLAAQHAAMRTLAEGAENGEVRTRLLEGIATALGWHAADLWEVDAAGETLCRAAWWSAFGDPATADALGGPGSFARGQGLPGRVWDRCEPVWLPDAAAEPGFTRAEAVAEAGLHAAMAVPVRAGGRVVGVLELFAARVMARDLELLGAVASIGGAVGQWVARSRAEAELRLNEQRFRAALAGSPGVVFNQDRELRYTWIHNPALGIGAADVLGKTDHDLFERREDAEASEAVKRRVLASGVGERVELAIWDRGERRFYDLTVEPLRGAGGEIEGVTCAAVDVTERKRAEAALLEAGREAAEHAAELTRLNGRLEEQSIELEVQATELQERAEELEVQVETSRALNDELEASNAGLLQANRALERARDRADFLAEASIVLASSLDHEATLASVTRLAVPRLADWCAVDVLKEDGSTRRIAIAHADPAKAPLACEIAERYPVTLQDAAGMGAVLRTGEPELLRDIPDEVLARVSHDPERLRLLRALGLRACIAVPLEARGERFGVLGLFQAESNRTFTDDDLALARELARRAEVAIDHARLFREAAEARARAEESEARFRTLAETIPQLAWIAGADGSILWYNRRWYDYTGTTPDEMQGWGWRAVHHPDHVAGVEARFRAAVASGQPWEDTFPLRGADGEYRWFLSRALPLRDEAGHIVRWFGTNTDVEEQRRAEAERDRALTEAQAARRAADAANRAKSQFLANMSHEIRTPINAILGYTELLEMGISGPLNEKQQAQLGRVRSSSAHLLGLVNDILDLSKVEAGEMSFASEVAPARASGAEALSLVAPQAQARGLALSDASDCPGEVSYLGDPDRVRQILVNLLSNAVKFTERGSVTLCCHVAESRPDGTSRGPWVAFEVQDTGMGIAPEQLARIFDPFVQVEEGHTRTQGGTGLGLTISRRFARLMGGDLTVKSALGQGSCFVLWLPAAGGEAAETAAPDQAEGWRTRAGEVEGLAELGRIVAEQADGLVRTLAGRLRADDSVPGARELDAAQLEDHIVTFLTDLGKTLVTLDAGDGEPDLLRDGMDIKRLISVRHGEQRARLGWEPVHVRREYALLREEMEALVRREAPSRTDADVGEALGVVLRLIEASERMAIEALEEAHRQAVG